MTDTTLRQVVLGLPITIFGPSSIKFQTFVSCMDHHPRLIKASPFFHISQVDGDVRTVESLGLPLSVRTDKLYLNSLLVILFI